MAENNLTMVWFFGRLQLAKEYEWRTVMGKTDGRKSDVSDTGWPLVIGPRGEQ